MLLDRRQFLGLIGATGALPFLPVNATAASKTPLGLNFSMLNYYSNEHPFSNLAYAASRWRLQERGKAFSWDEPLPKMTAEAYPEEVPANSFLESFIVWNRRSHLPQALTVLYDGKGRIDYTGGAQLIERAPGRDQIRNLKNDGPIIAQLVSTDSADPLRNLRIYEGMEEPKSLYRKPFLDRLKGMQALRFMDWMNTNNSKVVRWDERPRPNVFGQTQAERGMPVEEMVALCNTLKVAPWFTMPHLADDDYIKQFAEQVRDTLEPSLPVYVEYSNEVWNGMFEQARYAAEQGMRLGLSGHPFEAGLRFYATRTTEVLAIWDKVFGNDAKRVLGVYGSQYANEWVSSTILSVDGVKDHADALAIAPYFGGGLGGPDRAGEVRNWSMDKLFDALSEDIAGDNKRLVETQAAVAKQFGVTLVAYEGGQHLVGHGGAENDDVLTALFIAANRDPRMGKLYQDHLKTWWAAGGDVYVLYASMQEPTKWGSWGLLEYEGGPHAKWDAAQAFLR